jgi:hypothetical protein
MQETLVNLTKKIAKFENSITKDNNKLQENFSQILEVIVKQIEESWSGYWIKGYASLYFDGFTKPPANALFNPQNDRYGGNQGWSEVKISDMEELIKKHFKFNLLQAQQKISDQIKLVEELRDDLSVELSVIKSNPRFINEVGDLEEIEAMQIGISAFDFIQVKRPKIWIGSLQEIQSGFEVPSHIQYQARIIHLDSSINDTYAFIKKSKKLIRKIQIKENINQEQPNTLDAIEKVIKICDSFHAVARQLRERHLNRETLNVQDEYDVQDLLHALLKILFVDIRPEESTPSFAGGSSRIDFLLKREKIIIEIKKTRPSLTAKKLGDELLIDIARYKSHSDCQNLIFFIYDPEGIITNPKGLEDDLKQRSNDEINVIAIICPS